MKPHVKLWIVLFCYSCYMAGGFLSAWLVMQDNRVGAVLAVVIPTTFVGIYLSLVVNAIQPRKKRLPVRRASRVVKPRMKVVR